MIVLVGGEGGSLEPSVTPAGTSLLQDLCAADHYVVDDGHSGAVGRCGRRRPLDPGGAAAGDDDDLLLARADQVDGHIGLTESSTLDGCGVEVTDDEECQGVETRLLHGRDDLTDYEREAHRCSPCGFIPQDVILRCGPGAVSRGQDQRLAMSCSVPGSSPDNGSTWEVRERLLARLRPEERPNVITPEDASLHRPTSEDPTWAETNFFGFYVPELNLNCGVYVLLRTNLGVAVSTIHMCSRRADAHWEADFADLHSHLAMGPDFDLLDYSLANGLKVRCTDPNMAWSVAFDDGDGTSIHFDYTSLMDPFDINDPDQDPMVAAAMAGSDFQWGTAYAGHFDQTGVFEGEVSIRGRSTPFRCVSTMDHSWGLRAERHNHTMSWLHAHFSEDRFMHGIFDFDADDLGALRLTHGYVAEAGEVFGLSAGHGRTVRRGFFPEEKHLEVTDERGKVWTFDGVACTGYPWQSHPNVVGFNALMNWTDQDGRTGKGETQDFLGLQTLNRLSGGLAAGA